MPRPLYLHPFHENLHYIGVGPKSIFTRSAKVSLHGISPTITSERARYKYLSKMEPGGHAVHSALFNGYTHVDHRIYVMGHGAAGDHIIYTESGNPIHNSCTAIELGGIFERHGLPHASQVTIRIHACHSAMPSVAGANDSFAHNFRDDMVARGYHNLTIQGYTVGVGMYLFFRWGENFFSKANSNRVTV